ncbi:MAG: STAS domain-containing protein [Spirochaetia bacterium]|nr:STAS domain-containing protein [Spirochaetia bacterium]
MLEKKQIGQNTIISLEGRLDIELSKKIETNLLEVIKEHPKNNMIINLKKVDYMSSSGIRMIIQVFNKLKRKNQRLLLCELNENIKKVFNIVGLIDILEIVETEKEAIIGLS